MARRPLMSRPCTVAACAVLLQIMLVEGAKFDFSNQILPPLTQISRRHGMFAPDNTPATGPPGDGQSYIDIEVAFRRPNPTAESALQVVIFHNEELENVHRAADNGHFCRTYRNQGKYGYDDKETNMFVETYQPLYRIDVELPANDSAVVIKGRYNIEKTGLHYLMYSSCLFDAGDVFIDGHNSWMNPYGYLSGELYYSKPFFLAMSFIHLFILLFWVALLFKYREEVIPVQFHICGVLVLALIEVVLWYSEFSSFNVHGQRPMVLMVSAIIIGTMKKTVSRLLVLVVCMGYGIVRPDLGARGCQVAVFGLTYGLFSAILDVVKALQHDNDVSGGFFILVIIPVAVLDSVFYLWTFMSLYDVVAQLEEQRQSQKLQLYRRFIWMLGTCLVFSCIWVLFQMYFLYTNMFPYAWKYTWLFEAYWYGLAMFIMVAIMYLWAPNENSKNYAYYSESVNLNDADDEDGIELDSADNSLAPAFSIDDEAQEEERFDEEAGEVQVEGRSEGLTAKDSVPEDL